MMREKKKEEESNRHTDMAQIDQEAFKPLQTSKSQTSTGIK